MDQGCIYDYANDILMMITPEMALIVCIIVHSMSIPLGNGLAT